MLNDMIFEKQGAYWVSTALSGGESGSLVLHLGLPKVDGVNIPNIILQSTTGGSWADRWSGRWGGKEWEENVVGIAAGQQVRLLVSVEPEYGTYMNY